MGFLVSVSYSVYRCAQVYICTTITAHISTTSRAFWLLSHVISMARVGSEKPMVERLYQSRLFRSFQMSDSEDLDNDIDELIQEFEAKAQRPILHTVQFY